MRGTAIAHECPPLPAGIVADVWALSSVPRLVIDVYTETADGIVYARGFLPVTATVELIDAAIIEQVKQLEDHLCAVN